MKLKLLALAALVASSFGANAALTTYAPWDAAMAGNGLAGVLFNVQSSGGVTVALGAHAYKNGVFLANDGATTFNADSGVYVPDSLGRANWSFDFAWDLGNCTGCTVTLAVDTDPTAGETLVNLFSAVATSPVYMDSWNMEMNFGGGGATGFAGLPGNVLQGTYNFDPFSASSTAFRLSVVDSSGSVLASNITVNVPEPATLALAGLALAGLATTRRRRA